MLERLRILGLLLLLAGGCAPFKRVPPDPVPAYTYAEDALRRGEYQDAVVRFNAFLGQTDDPAYRPRALYELAWAHYELHQYRQTLDMLTQLSTEFPKQSGAQVAALRGNAEYALGNQTNGFLDWEEAWQKGDDADREVLQGRMERALAAMNEPELRQLAALSTDPDVSSMIQAYIDHPVKVAAAAPPTKNKHTQQAEAETLSGGKLNDSPDTGTDFHPAAAETAPTPRVVSLASNSPPPPPLDDGPPVEHKPLRPETLPPDIVDDDVNGEPPPVPHSEEAPTASPRVAALLPLTGPNRQAGWDALNALRLAFLDTPNALTVRDTAGEPALAKDLLNKVAADPSVVVVIGPIGSTEADAVGKEADRLKIPVALLAEPTDIHSRFVLRMGSQQVPDATETMSLRFQQYTGRAPTKAESQAFLTGFAVRQTITNGTVTRETVVVTSVPESAPGTLSAAQ